MHCRRNFKALTEIRICLIQAISYFFQFNFQLKCSKWTDTIFLDLNKRFYSNKLSSYFLLINQKAQKYSYLIVYIKPIWCQFTIMWPNNTTSRILYIFYFAVCHASYFSELLLSHHFCYSALLFNIIIFILPYYHFESYNFN